MKSAAAFVFIAILTVGAVAAQSLQASRHPPTVVLWQAPQLMRPCGGNATAQAVTVAEFDASSVTGCRSTWLVLLPDTEGGNASAELSFYQAHRGQLAGVILDDFSFSAAFYDFYSAHANDSSVCPVIYPYVIGTDIRFPQPIVTVGGACVILAIVPPGTPPQGVIAWESEIRADLAQVRAQNVHLLAYGSPTSFMGQISPAYLYAVANMSASMGESEILWH